ncbi:hypothetical protein KEM55_006155 [Ascosphaera atra]|nr:hypothetical protein KEM55_006155 [Ascosphaera atra]
MDVPTHEDTVSSFAGHGADMSSEQQDHPHADLQHSQTDILPESRLRSESTDSAGQRRLRSSSTSTTKSNDGSPHGLSKLLHSSKRRRRRQREVEEAAQQFPIPQLKVTSLKDDPVAESDTEVADQDLESKSTVASSSALASAPSSENTTREFQHDNVIYTWEAQGYIQRVFSGPEPFKSKPQPQWQHKVQEVKDRLVQYDRRERQPFAY